MIQDEVQSEEKGSSPLKAWNTLVCAIARRGQVLLVSSRLAPIFAAQRRCSYCRRDWLTTVIQARLNASTPSRLRFETRGPHGNPIAESLNVGVSRQCCHRVEAQSHFFFTQDPMNVAMTGATEPGDPSFQFRACEALACALIAMPHSRYQVMTG